MVDNRLDRANKVLHELKDAGYSNKELNELSLIVLVDMGLTHVSVDDLEVNHEQETGTDGNSL